jgi:DNA adenine methylase
MALSYIGGKSRIAPKLIIPNIPRDIEVFCEPFSGMFWTFFKLPLNEFKNLKEVVYNDFNPLNVNLFNSIRNYEEFYEVIRGYQSQDKNLFKEFQMELFHPEFTVDLSQPDFEVAAKYSYILTQVWSGQNPAKSKFIDLRGKYRSKFDSFKSKLVNPKWQKYFDKITHVENLDFEKAIKKWDSPKTHFYCDPPYYRTEDYYANHEFGIQTHERLANTLKSIQGQFTLSYYQFEQLGQWFPKSEFDWKSGDFPKASMAKSGKPQTQAVELLIKNY